LSRGSKIKKRLQPSDFLLRKKGANKKGEHKTRHWKGSVIAVGLLYRRVHIKRGKKLKRRQKLNHQPREGKKNWQKGFLFWGRKGRGIHPPQKRKNQSDETKPVVGRQDEKPR